MKKNYIICLMLLMSVCIYGQSPEKFSYQAIVRNNSNELIINQSVGMRISILQNSPNGLEVYVEDQIPFTNSNGLISIEIGAGTVINGSFAGIDWATGSYFIKTETDPTGGNNYTIVGTSQLLSVPYALYARKAGSTDGTSGYRIGDHHGGGIVFWVDQTGQHGLIVSMIDLSTSQTWSNITDIAIGSTNDWDGVANTTAIVNQNGHTSSGAMLCDEYTNADYGTGVYSDWFLPSRAELIHIWNRLYEIQKALSIDGNMTTTPLLSGNYWSSTEDGSNGAFFFSFQNGSSGSFNKLNLISIRAVRAF